MTRFPRASLLLILLLAILAQAVMAASPGISSDDAKNIMPVSQLKRGMRGYGLTVFHGTKVEKFDVVILGVVKQANMGKDLILVRIGGGPITKRETGLISGMSGSPCYINGKLVGAIAFAPGYAKEPIGMLTPIADMLEAWDENLPKEASGYSSPRTLEQPVSVGGRTASKVMIDRTGARSGIEDGVLYMQPLMTPMMVSGLSRRGIQRLAEILAPYGVQPMAGPGGGGGPNVSAALVPGAALGMSIATGDIDLTAIGTLTYRRGNRILAFGHPMLEIGAIDAPMTTAYVDDVISSYRMSVKMSSPIKTVGRIFQDRPFSIAGQVHATPKTIPITIRVDDQAFKRKRTFKVRLINHPLLASRFATLLASEAIYQMHPTPGDATAEVTYKVVADQVGTITRTNVFFDPVAVDMASISDLGTLLQLLGGNQFYPLDIKSVEMNVKILGKRNTATIDRIFVKEAEYEPGETVEVGVVLRPYKKDRITKTIKIKVPATAPDGRVTLQVRGGSTPAPMASPMGPGGPVVIVSEEDGPMPGGGGSDLANADNVKQLIEKYLEREKNNEIVAQLLLRSTAVNVAGEKLTGLPASIANVMKSSRNSGVRTQREEAKEVFPQDMIVMGAARLSITIKRETLKETRPAPKPEPSAPDGDEGDSSTATMSVGDYDGEYVDSMLLQPTAEDAKEPAPDEGGDGVENGGDEEPVEEEAVEIDKTEKKPDEKTDEATKEDGAEKEKPKTDAETQTNIKTVVRQPKTWSLKSQADYAKGTFSGVSASSKNKLQLAPTLKKLAETPEQFIWSCAPAKDGIYVGTGNAGKIYHISDSGEVKEFFKTGELEVHSLVRDPAGNLYAGTSPDGKIFKITPEGSGAVFYKAAEKYVTALALDGEGNLYAGVGDAGKVYRIPADGKGALWAEINEQQILSLHWDVHGSLLAGTGINGNVYRIEGPRTAKPIFDAPEDAITSIVSDGEGNVYAGTSPKGSVYKITPDGRSESVYSKGAQVLSMACDARNNVYAVSDSTLVRIAPDKTVTQLDSGRDKVQFLSLVMNELTGGLYACTGNIGAVYSSRCCDVAGTYDSPVHDAGMISRWSRIKWSAETPEATSVELQTRTGNVDTPDSTWSDWSAAYTKGDGEQVAGKDARYIQYRVTLKTDRAEASPKVSNVIISYLTPNQKPTVKISEPAAGQVWAGKKTIKWSASDPDKDKLSYDVFYSKDYGKEWKTLVGGVTGKETRKLSEEEVTSKIKEELEKSPDVPEEMKKAVLKDSDKKDKTAEAKPDSAKPTSSTSHSWDTKKVDDGAYLIKVVASDKTSNGDAALADEVVSDQFTVCNTPPEVTLPKKPVELKAVGSATVGGTAVSKLVEIVGVQFRVDKAEWTAATADDGLFDSPSESFTATTGSLEVGAHKVEVQAIDAAGNASTKTVEVKVS